MAKYLSVIKHSAAIHMANTLSVTERKIYNALLYHARPNLARGADHIVKTSEIELAIGFKSNNRPYLVELTEGLREKSVRYNIFGKDRKYAEVWRMNSGILAEVGFSLKYSRCRYSFPNTLVELLKNPHLYARINLVVQSRIRGHHTLSLYEFYVDILGGNRIETEFEFLLADIKELLDIGDSYPEFKTFNRDIIQRAHREINEKTDINVEIIARTRSGRKVTGLRLRIRRLTLQRENFRSNGLAVITNPSLEKLLLEVFHSSATVERIIQEYGNCEYIRKNVEYACEMYAKGSVKNRAGYAMKALQEDYYSKRSLQELKVNARRKSDTAKPIAYLNLEGAERALEAHRIRQAEVRYANLSLEEKLTLEEAFRSSKEYLEMKSTLGCKFRPSSPFYRGTFLAFIADNLCTEQEFKDINISKEL